MVLSNGIIQPNWPRTVAASDDANQAITHAANHDPKEYKNAFQNPVLAIAVGTAENNLFIFFMRINRLILLWLSGRQNR